MPPLSRLWPVLEDAAGTAAVLADWRNRLGQDFDVAFSLLRPIDQYAQSYPDFNDPHLYYKVVAHSDDNIVGVHSANGSTIKLTKPEILIYRLDAKRLCRIVAELLGCDCSQTSTNGADGSSLIGMYRPFAGFGFSVYFTSPHDSADLRRAAEAIVAREDGPFILIAPTARRMRSDCEVLLKTRRVCFLALANAIVPDLSGKWTVGPEVSQQLAAFRQLVVPQAERASGPAFFPTPAGATWKDVRIKFTDGETVSIKVGGEAGVYLFSDMGMADGRSKRPNKQWELLRSFAGGLGTMTWKSPNADRKNQKRREYLARDLKSFFRIDGDPIVLTDDKKGWQTAFSFEPDV